MKILDMQAKCLFAFWIPVALLASSCQAPVLNPQDRPPVCRGTAFDPYAYKTTRRSIRGKFFLDLEKRMIGWNKLPKEQFHEALCHEMFEANGAFWRGVMRMDIPEGRRQLRNCLAPGIVPTDEEMRSTSFYAALSSFYLPTHASLSLLDTLFEKDPEYLDTAFRIIDTDARVYNSRRPEIVRWFKQHGFLNRNQLKRYDHYTLLHYAVLGASYENVVSAFESEGRASLDVQGTDGMTPLMLACEVKRPGCYDRIVEFLLDCGADARATNAVTGKTAMDYASGPTCDPENARRVRALLLEHLSSTQK